MQKTWVQSLAWEDLLENRMATHYSILAWRIPWTGEPGGLQSMKLQRVRHDWATREALASHIPYHIPLISNSCCFCLLNISLSCPAFPSPMTNMRCCAKSLQSCPTLCDPAYCSLPGSFVHGVLQASMPSSRGSSRLRDWTHVSYVSCTGRFFTISAT